MVLISWAAMRHLFCARATVTMLRSQSYEIEARATWARYQATVSPAVAAAASAGCRAAVQALAKHVIGSVSISALSADPKHRQHLSCLVEWQRSLASAKPKRLRMDCAGLVLLCYCLAQSLAADVPVLAQVSMVVRRSSSTSAAGP